ncbi:hypothetical protein WJX84_005633 [Apatococcus fuscideae]|uniref:Uncharacterized protein n=1 Tax=Apatococcus fuscideae TaxID=2026836 RepID=A0AAW1RG90_9CHLO
MDADPSNPRQSLSATAALSFVKGILPGDLVKPPSQRQSPGILAKALQVHLNDLCRLQKPVADSELTQAFLLDQAVCVVVELHSILMTLIQKLDEVQTNAEQQAQEQAEHCGIRQSEANVLHEAMSEENCSLRSAKAEHSSNTCLSSLQAPEWHKRHTRLLCGSLKGIDFAAFIRGAGMQGVA